MTMSKKSEKILKKHLPTLEEDVKDIEGKTMSPKVADETKQKALEILEKNFKGKQLEKMKAKLDETMKTMQENYGEKKTKEVRCPRCNILMEIEEDETYCRCCNCGDAWREIND